jgi:DNA polymerase-3 subunit gamma/tau
MRFEDVIGQEHITRTLRNSLRSGRIRHAYLFSGPRGTGKTTTARLLAKAINCTHPDPDQRPCNACDACRAVNEGRYLDLIEIDAATHTGVDDVRDLRDKIAFQPGEGRYKVYIIDEVHRFTGNAFDALLKTLEEPPPHAIFVLATTEIDKVPATIKSRCLPFEFRRVPLNTVADRLQAIVENEGLHIDRAALELIARHGTGSVRDSISLLDQIVTDPDEHITLDLAQRILGTASTEAVRDLVDAVIRQDAADGLEIINVAVDAGSDPRQFGQQVIEHLRAVLLAQTASANLIEASEEDRALFQQQAGRISRAALLRALRAFNDAVNDYRSGWQPQLALELALIESISMPQEMVYAAPAVAQPPASVPVPAGQPMPAVEAQPEAPPLIAPTVVRQRWPDVREAARKYNKAVAALMEHIHVQAVQGNVLVLSISDVFLDKLDAVDKREALEKALFSVLQTPLRVRVVRADAASAAAPISDDDPLIAAARKLGGEVSPYRKNEPPV